MPAMPALLLASTSRRVASAAGLGAAIQSRQGRKLARAFSAAAPPPTSAGSGTAESRWNASGRWEQDVDATRDVSSASSFLLQESYGEYFKVPNPSKLMTKIICTVGPATCSKQKLGEMLDAGMSAMRLNASHGDYEFFKTAITNLREAAESRRRICPVILDTKGPEVRIGRFPVENIEVQNGDTFTFYCDYDREGSAQGVGTTFDRLAQTVAIGDVILVDDGRLSFLTREIDEATGDVTCSVIMGGVIKSNKGLNLPGCPIDLPHLTEKDYKDIAFAVEQRVEYIAHSFTRSAAGILAVREIPGVVETGIHVIAKIESQEALNNINAITSVSDGIMVARGDLGVEIPLERVCSVQKRLIRDSNLAGKFVITATEMLDSMIHSPRPTRAEASDVANAVFDGTDCVMLSGETAVGSYPVATIQVMNRICKEAELDIEQHKRTHVLEEDEEVRRKNATGRFRDLNEAFSMAAVATAKDIDAALIIAVTKTGQTAKTLSKHFPTVPILALATSPKICAQVSLYRGVIPYLVHSLERASCVPRGIAKATELGLVSHGSRVVLVTGHDDSVANRLESFVVGASVPELSIIPGQSYVPGSSFHAP
ncbi:Pyruvate kinase [Hondaea fermentalgiana]|uniref:Pyruvate kinase n=1 Tax=Hondaea fermentalgiana TaxID=2315210 RepID=A0A2R5G8R2_9STRA|nr:Pyruvate kinase [Hondaea fermentalgiana]|eukprot:GBG27442.1 Pyruvate kinase [Hondaea fermentalgiana]